MRQNEFIAGIISYYVASHHAFTSWIRSAVAKPLPLVTFNLLLHRRISVLFDKCSFSIFSAFAFAKYYKLNTNW